MSDTLIIGGTTYTGVTGIKATDNNNIVQTFTKGGGGGGSVEAKDVNFIDYDGTILHSYTKTEFAALSALPANPSHDGLTAKGWNWTLANAKTYVGKYGRMNIGQMYKLTDGNTHIFITIPEGTPDNRLTFSVRFTQTVSNGVTVDWGDNSATETYSGTSAANHSHTYAQPGNYEITLDVTSGKVSFVGSSSYSIYGSTSGAQGYLTRNWINKIYFGDDVTSIGSYALRYCYALSQLIIPYGVTSIENYALAHCYSLGFLTIPDTITSFGSYVLQYCYRLANITIPNSVTSVGIGTAQYCYAFKTTNGLSHVASIRANAFDYCYGLTTAIIPDGVTSIGNQAFRNCSALSEIHVFPTTPPTLGTDVFSNSPNDLKIYVPYSANHSILTTYKSTTNWSTYASYMQEEPQ